MFKSKTIKVFLMFGVILFSVLVCGCNNIPNNIEDGTYRAIQIIEGVNPQSYWITEFDIDIKNKTIIYDNDNIGELTYSNDDISEIFDNDLNYLDSYEIESEDLIADLKNVDSHYYAYTPNFVFSNKVYILTLDENIYMVLIINGTNNIEMVKAIFKLNFKEKEEINNGDKQIIMDYIKYAQSIGEENLSVDEVEILENYGEYNGVIIVRINRPAYQVITYVSFLDIGINMQFSDSNTPLVYDNGDFYELKDAYKNGIITKEDLIEFQDKMKK